MFPIFTEMACLRASGSIPALSSSNSLNSYQAESFKGSVESIFFQRRTNHLDQLLERGAAISHADPKRSSLKHLPVVHAVPKGDGVRRIGAQVRTKAAKGRSFVKRSIDEIAVVMIWRSPASWMQK